MKYSNLYFEAHVTLSPVYNESLDLLEVLSGKFDFRVADFLMKKEGLKDPIPNCFTSSRDICYEALYLEWFH